MLGATLADWQKKREEEAARLAAMRSNVGGDEEEGSSKKKSPGRIAYEKKMQQKHIIGELQAAAKTSQAKPVNQLAKIDTDEERLEAYKQTTGYQARQQSYADYYAKKEQEKQNAVSAARWAGVASVVQAKQEAEEKNTGGKTLAMLIREDDPPNPLEKFKIWVDNNIIQPVKQWAENKIEQTWPALRATGPGENGIDLINKNRDLILGTVSSFNSFIKTYGGIPYKYEYMNRKGETTQEQQLHSIPINPTSLAISMSVQAEAPGIVDFFQWVFSPFNSPSYGMAQIEPDKYELIKKNIQPYVNLNGISNNPYFALRNPQVSTAAMIERVSPSLEICQKYVCTPTDKEIVIALSQNGPGFDAKRLEGILNDIEYVSENPETIINWQKYFNDQEAFSKEDGAYRYYILNWRGSGHNFDTWFMLNRYYNNAMVFEDAGNWSMPEGVNWEYLESLIENTPPAQP
ncbi:MAG: hypothetical protein HYZ22_05140 [Chloroflexi bacterium]|nr:hypothetical protein [Chloroflexota bacterium]